MTVKRIEQVICLVLVALVAAACETTPTPTSYPVVKLWADHGQVHLQHPDGPIVATSVLSGGEPFNDALVQVAMGLAINWPTLREKVGEVVLVDFDSEETLIDPKEAEYNPNLARSLLAGTGHDRFDAVILYDSGDDPATELADAVANYLSAVNISAARRGVASADARTRFADMIAAGESGFLIERRQ